MARVALAAVVVLIASVHGSYGQNVTDELARGTNFLIPASCADPPLKQLFTGVHEIQPSPGFGSKIEVLCDQKYDKGGWIVIQNRLDGSVYFEREWAEYKSGFGNLKGEFWLGLDKIHEITYSKKYELVILLTDWSDTVKYAKYGEFRMAGEAELYAIKKLGTFNGDKKRLPQRTIPVPPSSFQTHGTIARNRVVVLVKCTEAHVEVVTHRISRITTEAAQAPQLVLVLRTSHQKVTVPCHRSSSIPVLQQYA
ncbi:fibrinogen and fibronectin [Culex quinquefasciatus]|uniref:Fibrinogen and fibronectin n=1 Tax=Culex quinquefasciatus TaxID=7176 RepID=B0WNA5_CULQU|nr:fibrinogen and fibronectin [Culex quinquefasciatus]|eukprot:XP_001850189.1 fibrinogen and fibronectin [Culex quinquefasciatus]